MGYITKNYTTDGGDRTVIGGILEISSGATVIGLPKATLQPDSTATTVAGLVADINALLAKFKAAGIMADM